MAATDWIKMRTNLWDDPRISAVCDKTGASEATVIGGLYWLWAMADSHTTNGHLPGMALKTIDRKTGTAGFGEALVELGWVYAESAGITILKFEEHNGASAKKRADDAKRKANTRAGVGETAQLFPDPSEGCPKKNGQGEDKKSQKPELERDKNKKESKPKVKDIVGQKPDDGIGEQAMSEAETIEKIFDYWRQTMESLKSNLDDKRKGVIRRALKAGYSPRDLCRAIQGCSLTPHNQGDNDRGQKYLGIHVCLKDADQIDRFIANAKSPPVAPVKKSSGQIPGWWNSDELAKQQGALVGVNGPHAHETRETWHARIRAAIDNGGKPPAPIQAPAPAPAAPDAPRVEMTEEQKAANRERLHAALKGVGVKVSGNGITVE